MNDSAIRVDGLKKSYKNVVALDKLTFSVEKGSCFGLVGPNGAGKTTTINILSGVARPDYGYVEMLGGMMHTDNVLLKQRIGVLSETLDLFEQLKCEEFLFFVGRVYSLDYDEIKERVSSLLHALDLYSERHRFLHEYSLGMRKKTAFAAAVIHRPDILLLDEPFESIDPVSTSTIRNIIKSIQGRGGTLIITSHNLDAIEKLCDNVAIVNKGRLVFQSKTEDIRKKIKNEMNQETYQSLEEIFIDVVSEDSEQKEKKKLSWL